MHEHEKLNYLEFGAKDLDASKAFFSRVFNWSFTDYGPDYSAFENQGLDGGIFRSEQYARSDQGSALVIFYSADIHATEQKVKEAGGEIIRPLFDFPGGCRFHFVEPSGNEFAVWSETR